MAERPEQSGSCGPDCACWDQYRPVPAGEKQNLSIYLDHAASTPVREEVVDAMLPFFAEVTANPSSIHRQGKRARQAVELSRSIVAECIGAKAEEIVFTSGGTESDNIAIRGGAKANHKRGDHLAVSSIEHHAVLEPAEALFHEGYTVSRIPVGSEGVVELDSLAEVVKDETILVSVMLVNNETGVIQPLKKVRRRIRERILLHTDAAQAVGKMSVNVDDLGVDLLSFSGHKIGGPKGIGALYVRHGTRIESVMQGGSQERGLRPGTENVPLIVGLAKAVQLATEELQLNTAIMEMLRNRLQDGIIRSVEGAVVNGGEAKRVPNILNVSFQSVEGEALLLSLDEVGIAASTGAACTSGSLEPSHVLKAMGLERSLAIGSLRLSVGFRTKQEEIDTVIPVVKDVVLKLRRRTPPGLQEG